MDAVRHMRQKLNPGPGSSVDGVGAEGYVGLPVEKMQDDGMRCRMLGECLTGLKGECEHFYTIVGENGTALNVLGGMWSLLQQLAYVIRKIENVGVGCVLAFHAVSTCSSDASVCEIRHAFTFRRRPFIICPGVLESTIACPYSYDIAIRAAVRALKRMRGDPTFSLPVSL